MVGLTSQQGASDGSVSIGARATAAGGRPCVEPVSDGGLVEPERKASAVDQCGGILGPVTDAVTSGLLIHSRTRLPDLAHP